MIYHLFTLLFVALKLTGVIAWSWWWVLLPSLLIIALALLGIICALCGAWALMRSLH